MAGATPELDWGLQDLLQQNLSCTTGYAPALVLLAGLRVEVWNANLKDGSALASEAADADAALDNGLRALRGWCRLIAAH